MLIGRLKHAIAIHNTTIYSLFTCARFQIDQCTEPSRALRRVDWKILTDVSVQYGYAVAHLVEVIGIFH